MAHVTCRRCGRPALPTDGVCSRYCAAIDAAPQNEIPSDRHVIDCGRLAPGLLGVYSEPTREQRGSKALRAILDAMARDHVRWFRALGFYP